MSTHGIGYFKNILAAFSQPDVVWPSRQEDRPLVPQENKHEKDEKDEGKLFDQWEMNEFDFTSRPLPFDRVVYWYVPQHLYNKVSTFRREKGDSVQHSQVVLQDGNGCMKRIWQRLLERFEKGDAPVGHGDSDTAPSKAPSTSQATKAESRTLLLPDRGLLQDELTYVERNFPPEEHAIFRKWLWHYIHYYPVDDQIWWFREMAGLPEAVLKKVQFVDVSQKENGKLGDLRSHSDLASVVRTWLQNQKNRHKLELYLNISIVGYVLPTVLYTFAEANELPTKTYFISTHDHKTDDRRDRFKHFSLKQNRIYIIRDLSRNVRALTEAKNHDRKLAGLLLGAHLSKPSAFTVLLLGERGIGKSWLAEKAAHKDRVTQVSCASFDDDNKAEAELFGYVKGAFTGADRDKKGLFQESENKVLFLDEVHHLSKRVQAKLMAALATDSDGFFNVRKLGAKAVDKVRCNVILASNLSIDQLRLVLLPDFYDRITQFIIEIPPLRKTPEDRKDDWVKTREDLKFTNTLANDDPELLEWLQTLDLPGNYRDLQKIAIAYDAFENFSPDIKAQIDEKTPYAYARAQYEKYHGRRTDDQLPRFDVDLDQQPDHLLREFKHYVATQLEQRHGTMERVARYFGGEITPKTLYNWKNKK
jgi:transcriptional regulator with AAA-type ATPase domain